MRQIPFHQERVEILNKLFMVRWDRGVLSDPGQDWLIVYGWIDRPDEHSDFVVLTFVNETVGYTTSSAEYSKEIAEILYGEDAIHVDCVRVEDLLGDEVWTAIHLGETDDGGDH